MPTLRIAVVENSLFSTYTMREALMTALQNAGYSVTVFTHGNRYISEVEKTGIRVADIGSGSVNPLKMGRYVMRLFRRLKAFQPHIILTFSIRPAIFGNLIARVLKVPVITNITGTGPLFSSNNPAYSLARLVYKRALQKTVEVYFQNEDDLHEFVSRGFIEKGRTKKLPGSGVDHQKFHPGHAKHHHQETFVFLFAGRLIKDKGIFEYLEAATHFKNKNAAVTCRILGPFWSQNLRTNTVRPGDLEKYVERGIVEYLGEKQDIRQEIALANCIVLPSYREGISNVLLEASAMEKPVITCDTTGCREIVEEGVTGLLCRPKDATDLIRAMEKMLSITSEQRDQMGKNGRKKVIREFDKQIVINTYLQAIERIAASHTRCKIK